MLETEDQFSKKENPDQESRIGDASNVGWLDRTFDLRALSRNWTWGDGPRGSFRSPNHCQKAFRVVPQSGRPMPGPDRVGVRAWAAGFAGRHTRSSKIEGSKWLWRQL
jgi:hypothetical protein